MLASYILLSTDAILMSVSFTKKYHLANFTQIYNVSRVIVSCGNIVINLERTCKDSTGVAERI